MKTRVLVTGADNSPGGVLSYIESVVAHSDPERFEYHTTVSTLHGEGGRNYLHPRLIPHLFPTTYSLGSAARRIFQLRQLVKDLKIDVLHMHTLSAGLLGSLAAWGLPVRKIYTGHSWRYPQKQGLARRLFYRFEKFTCRQSDVVTFSTEHDRQFGLEHGLTRPPGGVVIRTRAASAVRRLESGERARLRQERGLPVDGFIVGTIAHMSARKDPLTFVRAAAQVVAAIPRAHFLWVGGGELREPALALARELGVADRLTITGIVSPDAIDSFLSVMDVFLFTSRNEGVPLSVLAAQRHGLPVVCSRYEGSGIDELIQHGETGWIFRPGDHAAAAEAVTGIFRDPGATDRVLGRMAARFAALHADPAAMAREFERTYLGQSPGP